MRAGRRPVQRLGHAAGPGQRPRRAAAREPGLRRRRGADADGRAIRNDGHGSPTSIILAGGGTLPADSLWDGGDPQALHRASRHVPQHAGGDHLPAKSRFWSATTPTCGSCAVQGRRRVAGLHLAPVAGRDLERGDVSRAAALQELVRHGREVLHVKRTWPNFLTYAKLAVLTLADRQRIDRRMNRIKRLNALPPGPRSARAAGTSARTGRTDVADDGHRRDPDAGADRDAALSVGSARLDGYLSSSVTGPSFTSATCMCSRKRPVATAMPACADRGDELLRTESLGHFRRRGVDEARPAALAAIAQQRELADDEHRAADFGQPAVHLAVVVVEDAQSDDLLGELPGVVVRIAAATPSSTSSPRSIRPTISPATVTQASVTRWTRHMTRLSEKETTETGGGS